MNWQNEIPIHIFMLVALPPLLYGIINRTKAIIAGRRGPPLFQVYYDIAKLLRKGMVFSHTTTWVFRAGPVVNYAALILAGLMVPLGGPALLRFEGDFILVGYLFAMGRFFMAIAALDTGSSFEGMGTSREMTFSTLAEPTFFAGMIVLARLTHSLTLSTMLSDQIFQAQAVASLLLLGVSWFILMLSENSRIPFDDPNTHLELTMIHEVIVLDHSGPALALIEHGATIRLFLMSAMIVQLALPFTPEWGMGRIPAFLAMTVIVGVAIGLIESGMARLRLTNVPGLLISSSLLSFFSFILLLR